MERRLPDEKLQHLIDRLPADGSWQELPEYGVRCRVWTMGDHQAVHMENLDQSSFTCPVCWRTSFHPATVTQHSCPDCTRPQGVTR
jgi:hypothetical protein